MKQALPFWHVDAFADRAFAGNPAAVVVADAPLPEDLMQAVAAEMNLSETAFVERRAGQNPLLRWFTVVREIDLCGHATLATAHVWLTALEPGAQRVVFDTLHAGPLPVERGAHGYTMDLPARQPEPLALSAIPGFVLPALSPARPVEAHAAGEKALLVYADPASVRAMRPDFLALRPWTRRIIVTAPSDDPSYAFISRHFNANDPAAPEDPVCGSAHCALAPYWAARLGKTAFRAWQASARGGALDLALAGARVRMGGPAVTVARGELYPNARAG
ncbi:MAG: PhzF family phenazine biosynthesis protein [Alphaproteobacteria bacterium]|jgi:PhzF family phenazine biosynthesis protein|nr:PhzF family phenazine biosynthesis protein [Alphaproteobacteria bacterium]